MLVAKKLLPVALAGIVALCVHCTTSTILVSTWQNHSYAAGSLKHPVVVAVAKRDVVRVKIEDALVAKFQKLGIDAIASHSLFPGLDPTPDLLKEKLPSSGRDSVVITHLVDVKRETVYVPASTEVYPSYEPGWGGYYSHSYGVVWSPAYTYETKKYVLETKLYDVSNDKLVWAAVTETQDPTSLDSAVDYFSDIIAEDVGAKRLF